MNCPAFIFSFLPFFLFLSYNFGVEGQIYAAQVDLQKLLNTNVRIIRAFKDHLEKEREKLSILKSQVLRFHELRGNGSPEVLQNPLTAFLTLKSLNIDLDQFLQLASTQTSLTHLTDTIEKIKTKFPFPTGEDLLGSVEAIKRIQETYKLPLKDLVNGQVRSHCCTEKLTADDCFELGHQNFISGQFDHSIMWLNQSWTFLEDQKPEEKIGIPFKKSLVKFKTEVLELLSKAYEKRSSFKNALKITKILGEMDPENLLISEKVAHFEILIARNKEEKDVESEFEYQDMNIIEKRTRELPKLNADYESLCRGELKHQEPKLTCRYFDGDGKNHYLKIGPIKEEMLYKDPKIYLFHEILYESEIDRIKKMATPKFKRASVREAYTGKLVPAKYRISKSSWLYDQNSKLAKKISTRVEQITGLSMMTAEPLQVVNYGLGGQYDAHTDFIPKDGSTVETSFPGIGNRVATFLAYMSEVAEGGATVFPLLNLSVSPLKGAAAFWYNLFPDGQGDLLTRHGACPVVRGSKWVVNKWIHEVGQETRRPCGLERMDPNDERTD